MQFFYLLEAQTDTPSGKAIENDKSNPSLSSLTKIAKALGVSLADLFSADEVFKDVNSIYKTLMEKISLIDSLEPV